LPQGGREQTTCGIRPQTLARDSQNDPDLGRVIDAWPALPKHVKAAVLTLVNAAAGRGTLPRNLSA